nr:retrovirus-related Pol polyprotein from transposon TNT 1-94 [Tanacetum cinerariifolium]
MVEKFKLDEDPQGKAINPTHYHGMIDTLMYLTANRPDLTFVVCMCARYQAKPTKKHLHAVKRKLKYLIGTVNRGLWYPKDSSIALTAYADANHTGCQDARRTYKEYYVVASGAVPPKAKTKHKKKTGEPFTSPKSKTASDSKGTKHKSKAKVALSEAEQIKLATKRSKKDYHISHASGLGDGVDTQSKVPDKQEQKTSGTDEGTGEDDDGDNDDGDNYDDGESDDHDDDSDDEITESDSDEIPDPNLTNVDQTKNKEEDVDEGVLTPSDDELTDAEKLDNEETMDDEENDEVLKELYEDVNVNLKKDDAEMTDANQGADNEIASLMETSAPHATAFSEITSGFTTTTPPPPLFFNPILQQQTPTITTPTFITPTFTTITSINPIVTLPKILNFASVFKFDQRVSALESKMSELKQTNQFAEAVSLIPSVFDKYLASKMKEAIEKYVTETLGAEVLVRSTNQPQTAYVVAASLLEFKLKKILIDKMGREKSIKRSDTQKNLYNALVKSYKSYKDIITSYGDVILLKRGRDDQDKDEDPSVGSDRGTKRRKSGKDVKSSKDSRSKEKKSSRTSKDVSSKIKSSSWEQR